MALNVVMFVYNDTQHDARVWREAKTLTDAGFAVLIVGLQTVGASSPEHRPEGRLLRVGGDDGVAPGDSSPFRDGGGFVDRARWLAGYIRTLVRWRDSAARTATELVGSRPTVWHGHDLPGLMAASAARRIRHGPLVYDSHELFSETGSAARLPWPARSMLRRYEDHLAQQADAVITVNDSIRVELGRRFRSDPIVVMNCPPLGPEPEPRFKSPLRSRFDLGSRPVMVHHGGISEGRGILDTVAALNHLPPEVALVILGNGALVPRLVELAVDPRYRARLFVHPAVSMADVRAWISGADVGVIAFEPINRNNVLGTPNKLFEYMAAGVPSVVSDFPEMRRIIADTGAGVTCEPGQPKSIAAAASNLLFEEPDRRADRSRRCRAAAVERYNWETEGAKIVDIYRAVVTSG